MFLLPERPLFVTVFHSVSAVPRPRTRFRGRARCQFCHPANPRPAPRSLSLSQVSRKTLPLHPDAATTARPTITTPARKTPPADEGNSRSLPRSEEHTSELQSHSDLVCRLLLEK